MREPLSNLAKTWMDNLRYSGLRDRTCHEHGLSVLLMLKEHPEPYKTLATEDQVLQWASTGREGQGANRLILHTFRFMGYASRHGWPCCPWANDQRRIPRVRVGARRKLVTVPDKEVIQSMIQQEPRIINTVLLTAMYACGLRLNEVIDLNIIDLRLNHVKIHGKGGKERLIPIPFQASKALTAWAAHRLIETLGEDGPMFTIHDKRIKKFHIAAICREAGKRVNIKLNPHLLRHSYATHLLQAGLPITKLSGLMGHTNISTTWGYIHLTPDAEDVAMHPMGGMDD